MLGWRLIQRRRQVIIQRQYCRYFGSSSRHDVDDNDVDYDVIIVGGGVVGATLAKNIAPYDTKLLVLDGGPPKKIGVNNDNDIPNPRSYAISPFSWKYAIGEDILSSVRVGTYNKMQVWESQGPATLTFTENDIDDEYDYLGAVVEDGPLVSALWDQLSSLSSEVHLQTQARVEDIQTMNGGGASVTYTKDGSSSSRRVTTKLVLAADGANSFVRRRLNMPVVSYGYGRKALTCTVELETDMPPVAFQRMETNGPIALLPTYNPKYATIVWSTTPEQCHHHQQKSSLLLTNELNQHLQSGPTISKNNINGFLESANTGLTMKQWNDRGPFVVPPMISNVVGPVMSFDLTMMQARSYVHNNNVVALVGDAAHTIHPMAGQGLNLGLADVVCLTQLYKDAIQSGTPPNLLLHQYQTQRQLAVSTMLLGVHIIHESYRYSNPLQSIGMNLINTTTPIRQTLAQMATGTGPFGI